MPYVNCTVSKELNKNDMEKLKVHIADLINQMPEKSEEWLMIGFTDKKNLYFRGVKTDAAFIEVKLLGTQEIKYKDIFTASVSELFEDELNIPKNNIYVVFTEVVDGNWGWNGQLF
jgi:phenylpyruvate tautomerase PptA (4-oxalocrotonate tautomerase family)